MDQYHTQRFSPTPYPWPPSYIGAPTLNLTSAERNLEDNPGMQFEYGPTHSNPKPYYSHYDTSFDIPELTPYTEGDRDDSQCGSLAAGYSREPPPRPFSPTIRPPTRKSSSAPISLDPDLTFTPKSRFGPLFLRLYPEEAPETIPRNLPSYGHERFGDCKTWSKRVDGGSARVDKVQKIWECHICKTPRNLNTTIACMNPDCLEDTATPASPHRCLHEGCDLCLPERFSHGTRSIYNIPRTLDETTTISEAESFSEPKAGPNVFKYTEPDANLSATLDDSQTQRRNPDWVSEPFSRYVSVVRVMEQMVSLFDASKALILSDTINEDRLYRSPSIDENPQPSASTGKYHCVNCDALFLHKKDCLRHQATVHLSPKQYLCLEAGCKRSDPQNGFSRRDHLRNHMNRFHGKTLKGLDKFQFSHMSYTPKGQTAIRSYDQTLRDIVDATAGLTETGKPTFIQSSVGVQALQSLNYLSDLAPPSDTPQYPRPKAKLLEAILAHYPQKFGRSDASLDPRPLFHKHQKFRDKVTEALQKLQSAAPKQSAAFKAFVADIGDIDNIINTGYSALCEYIDEAKKRIPEDLKSLYCMLHVCYAMSQTTDKPEVPIPTIEEFGKSATEWKGCLPEVSDAGVHEQDLFDELVSVMWIEFSEAWNFMENSDWEKILGPEFVNFDPSYDPIHDFDTGDPYFNLSEFMNIDTLSWDNKPPFGSDPSCPSSQTGNISFPLPTLSFPTHISNPTPTLQDLVSFSPQCSGKVKLSRPTWETLLGTLAITLALGFIRELQETSAVFLYICGKIVGTIFDNGYERSQFQKQLGSTLSLDQRQDVMKFLQDSLPQKLSPILNAVSGHFLGGVIDTLHDLEECMVAFLMICCTNPHNFLCFFSDIISRFYSYYHTRLPRNLKFPDDVYNCSNYVSDKRREQERTLATSSSDTEPKSGSSKERFLSASPVEETPSISKLGKRKLPESTATGSQPLSLSDDKRPRLESGITTCQENKVEYKWKVTTGQPRKRRNILKNLPRATNPQ